MGRRKLRRINTKNVSETSYIAIYYVGWCFAMANDSPYWNIKVNS